MQFNEQDVKYLFDMKGYGTAKECEALHIGIKAGIKLTKEFGSVQRFSVREKKQSLSSMKMDNGGYFRENGQIL